MPQRKHDPRLLDRHLRGIVPMGGLFLTCVATAWLRPQWFWPAFVLGSGLACAGLVMQELRFRRYRCPDCGAMLSYRRANPGAPIEYNCKRCDVIWTTGFVESAD